MSVTVVVCVMVPPLAEMVTVWAPVGAPAGIVMVRVEVPAPGAGIGLGLKVKAAIDDFKFIFELNPPETVVLIVTVPVPPRAMLIELGVALIVKSGDDTGAKSLIRALPFGLPQPVTKS